MPIGRKYPLAAAAIQMESIQAAVQADFLFPVLPAKAAGNAKPAAEQAICTAPPPKNITETAIDAMLPASVRHAKEAENVNKIRLFPQGRIFHAFLCKKVF